MKRRHRYRYMLNIFSLGLLAFALYLNFFKREAAEVTAPAKENWEHPASLQPKQESKALSANHTTTSSFVLK